MPAYNLQEVDSLEIQVVVNDEVDQFSHSPNALVQHKGSLGGIKTVPIPDPESRGGASEELKMSQICCGALGFSAVVTVTKGESTHTLLFDTGPEEDVWERNCTRLGLDAGAIEHIHLSHWHRDHSGGMLKAISIINGQKAPSKPKVVVDLHPDRPAYRGVKSPTGGIISLEADPSFNAIEAAGAVLVKSDKVHSILDGTFLVSGEIPRVTDYETGMQRAVRFMPETKEWVTDMAITDERLVMCNLKGKGLVVFTGCSHAGVVNVARHAKELGNGAPLYSIVGGYHLADADPEKRKKSMDDLKALDPKLLMPGHCTGWKFKNLISQELGSRLVPIFAGTHYTL
ncbi:hypothetical protein N7510_003838 [Penicillium lagena]|uniref:uncharacterized protein n=1 Tax=Penicillium lagena TaxID=94218 RepID=UPI00254077D2|nr:uncharacterized protein N7510_003838 [Penicillium lagena]KAJ5619854.1 hypothetical protein N7510_003838 [Penicillium lagena]